MSLPKRVVLVGPMGAGKSTIGRMLAKELGYRFLDSDRIIEERCGANIPWIFDVEGEDGFRQRETTMLDELSNEINTVLATGGGAVMRPENHPLLKKDAMVVYLKTSIESRLSEPEKTATGRCCRTTIRKPFYESCSRSGIRFIPDWLISSCSQIARAPGLLSGNW